MPNWDNFTGESELVDISPSRNVSVYIDHAETDTMANARALLADSDRIYRANSAIFGVTGSSSPVNVLLWRLKGKSDGSAGADHGGCDFDVGSDIEICVSLGHPARDSGLFEGELSECYMGGNLCQISTGEALSRWCARAISDNALSDFATATVWAKAGMPDFVTTTYPDDKNEIAIGCGMVFLSWLMSKGHTLGAVAQALVILGPTGNLAQLYAYLTGEQASSALPAFMTAVEALSNGVTTDDPFGAATGAGKLTPSRSTRTSPISSRNASLTARPAADGESTEGTSNMSVSVAFTMQPQQEDEWCWAANAASAAGYFGKTDWSQCLLANDQFAQSTCCDNGKSAACDKPWFLDRALTAAGCHYSYQANPIPLADVVSALSATIAIEVRIGWTDGQGNFDGSGHFVAITGADPASATLHIADPWYPSSDIGYDDFAERYQTVGVWTDSFLIDRLSSAAAGGGAPSPASKAESELIFEKARIALTTMNEEVPLYTLTLDKAVEPSPLSAMSQTGTQILSKAGVVERALAIDAKNSVRADVRAVSQARATRELVGTLKDARVLQIPSLLVTAVVGSPPSGGTAIKPIGRIPSFLEDRLYSQPDFEAIIQRQAARKIKLLSEMHNAEAAANEGYVVERRADDADGEESDVDKTNSDDHLQP